MKEKQEIIFKRVNINNIHNARKTAVRFKLNEIKENNIISNSVIKSQSENQNYDIKKLTNSNLYAKHTVVNKNYYISNKIANKTISSEDELNIMKESNSNKINYNELKKIHKANKDDLLHFQKSINFNKVENISKLKDVNDKKRLKGKVAKIIQKENKICKKLYNDTLRINNLVALSIAKQIHLRKYKYIKNPPFYDYPDPQSILSKMTEFKNENLSQYYYDIDHIKDGLITKKTTTKRKLK